MSFNRREKFIKIIVLCFTSIFSGYCYSPFSGANIFRVINTDKTCHFYFSSINFFFIAKTDDKKYYWILITIFFFHVKKYKRKNLHRFRVVLNVKTLLSSNLTVMGVFYLDNAKTNSAWRTAIKLITQLWAYFRNAKTNKTNCYSPLSINSIEVLDFFFPFSNHQIRFASSGY